MNKQQTAVEWLLDRIEDVDNTPEIWELIKDKAKEMEKQQIIDAHNQGYADGYRDNGNSPIDYFTETFKK